MKEYLWPKSWWWKMTMPAANFCGLFWRTPLIAVRVAADGQAALDAVAAEHPGPDGVGRDAPGSSRLRSLPPTEACGKTAKIKILILSAKTFQADKHQALSVGADDFLSKPVEPGVLLEHVSALLAEKHRPRSSLDGLALCFSSNLGKILSPIHSWRSFQALFLNIH
jgi:DNA-binding response OmpR family regulator